MTGGADTLIERLLRLMAANLTAGIAVARRARRHCRPLWGSVGTRVAIHRTARAEFAR